MTCGKEWGVSERKSTSPEDKMVDPSLERIGRNAREKHATAAPASIVLHLQEHALRRRERLVTAPAQVTRVQRLHRFGARAVGGSPAAVAEEVDGRRVGSHGGERGDVGGEVGPAEGQRGGWRRRGRHQWKDALRMFLVVCTRFTTTTVLRESTETP